MGTSCHSKLFFANICVKSTYGNRNVILDAHFAFIAFD